MKSFGPFAEPPDSEITEKLLSSSRSRKSALRRETTKKGYQGRKRNLNPNFLVWISLGGVGVFHVKGWGPKVRYVLRNPGKPNFLAGYPGILPGWEPEKFEKKKFVFNSRPLG